MSTEFDPMQQKKDREVNLALDMFLVPAFSDSL